VLSWVSGKKLADSLGALIGVVPTLQQVFDVQTGEALLNKNDTINATTFNLDNNFSDGLWRLNASNSGATNIIQIGKGGTNQVVTAATGYKAEINITPGSYYLKSIDVNPAIWSRIDMVWDSIIIRPSHGNLTIDSLNYNADANLVSLVQDTTNGKIYRKTITGGGTTLSSVGGGLDIQDGGAGNVRTLNSSDFDVAANLISIDYTNGQAASTSNKGFLTNTDWNTFNNKEAAFTETKEEFTGSTSSTVTVANTPKTSKARLVYFNGVMMKNSNVSISGSDFTISGITRETSDIITVKYSY